MAVALLRQIRRTAGLAPTRKTVLAVLAEFAAEDGSRVFPSIALLALHTGLAERTIQASLRWLEGEGWIVRERLGGGRGRTNRWRLYVAPEPVQLGLTFDEEKGARGARKGAGAAPDLSEIYQEVQDLPARQAGPAFTASHETSQTQPSDPGVTPDRELAPALCGLSRPAHTGPDPDRRGLDRGGEGARGAPRLSLAVSRPHLAGQGRGRDGDRPGAADGSRRAFLDAYRTLVARARDAPVAPTRRARRGLRVVAGAREPAPLDAHAMNADVDDARRLA